MSGIPVLYFSFANQPGEDLSYLKEELNAIEGKLERKDASNKIKFKKKTDAQVADIFESLPYYRNDLVLFHYAGHANGAHLQYGDHAANADALAGFFRDYKRLKLVFLNGCSTEDQVLGFLEGGVDAVIATTVPVQDQRAANFAIQFYHALEIGSSLSVAYNHAVQSVLVNGEKDKAPIRFDGKDLEVEKVKHIDNGVTTTYDLLVNPTQVRGQALPTFTGSVPWGLYYKKEAILDWELSDDFPGPSLVALNEDYLQKKQKELENAIQRLDGLDQEITDCSIQAQALNSGDESLEALNQALENFQIQKRRQESRIFKLKQFIRELESGEDAKIQTAINQINYKDQIEFFADWKNKQQIGAFLIQGTMRCGHDFLVDEVAPKQVLNFTQDRFKDFRVYFDDLSQNNTFTEAALWKNVRMSLGMRPARDQVEAKVTQKIKSILQTQHLLLVFDGVTHLAAAAISAFWNGLLELLKPAHLDLQNAYPNRLILLLLDRNAELSLLDHTAVSQPKFAQAFGNIANLEKAPVILKPIRPLDQQALKDWVIDSDLPDVLLPDEQTQAWLLEQSDGYVIPMIRSFCDKIGKPDIFEKYYQQFDLE